MCWWGVYILHDISGVYKRMKSSLEVRGGLHGEWGCLLKVYDSTLVEEKRLIESDGEV